MLDVFTPKSSLILKPNQAEYSSDGSIHAFELGQAHWSLPPLPLLLGLVVLMAAPMGFGLLPVVASVVITALLLASLRPSTAAHGLLSSPPMVFVGLLSYSLYLWHWSVLSLSRWTIGLEPRTMPLQGPAHLSAGLFVLALRRMSLPPYRLVAPAMAGVGQWFSPCRFGCLWLAGLKPQGT